MIGEYHADYSRLTPEEIAAHDPELAELDANSKPKKTSLRWSYDGASDTFEIFGIRYAVDLFRELALGPIGGVFRIVARTDGVVTLETIPPSPEETAE
jgi:hypothetical protein